jgi:allantoin racemase
MTVDIGYLIPGRGTDEAECRRRERIADDHVSASVTVESVGEGPVGIESPTDEALAIPGLLKAAERAQSRYDALVIGCFGDLGIRPLRSLVDVPVVGPAETTLHTCVQLADRVGWLTILDTTVPMARTRVRELGFESEVVGIESVDTHVSEIWTDPESLTEAMVGAGNTVVERDGAEIVFPGCMSLAFAESHDGVQERLDVPVVDPLAVSLEQAETWARHGITHSRRSYPATPDESRSEL